jgi:hypothetical protein
MLDPRTELSNPSTPPERLAELAQQYPEYGPAISAHPNAYPELQAWITQFGPQQAQALAQAQQAQQQAQAQAQALAQQQQQPYGAAQAHGGPQAYGSPQGYDPAFQHSGPAAYGAQQQAAPSHQSQGAIPSRPRGRRRALLITLAAVLVMLLAAGGGVWWWLATKLGGSATPEAAATKLLTSAAKLDPLALYGSLAPSEIAPFQDPLQQLSSTSQQGSDQSVERTLRQLGDAISISVTGIETQTETIAAGVERVIFTDGELTVDGDEDRIVALVMDLLEEYSWDATGDDLHYFEEELRENIELPYTVDFRELRREAQGSGFEGVSLVSVEERGGWYVSPLMTQADYVYLTSLGYGGDYTLGTEIIAGQGSESPETAAEDLVSSFVDAIARSDRDFEEVAAHLPLAERRLLSIYGIGGLNALPLSPIGSAASGIEILEQRYSAQREGSRARISIDALEVGKRTEEHGFSLFNGVRVEGLCAETSNEWVSDVSDSFYYELWERQGGTSTGCLDDLPVAEELGLERLAVIAVEEQGGWYVSPIATYADAAAIVAERLQQLARDGELEDLFHDARGY